MSGIVGYGAYVPRHRLVRADIGGTLGTPPAQGERTVAGHDEDTTSMGVEAARRAVAPGDTPRVLALATTAPAYTDKTNATAIHAALSLAPEVLAVDFGASVRSAAGALAMARGAGGLAVLSDIRIGRPGSQDESSGGDGAAAFAFGSDEPVIAETLGEASASDEFLDRWRIPGEATSRVWEERFGLQCYVPLGTTVAERALSAAGIEAPDHVVVSSPHARAARDLRRRFPAASAEAAELGSRLGFLGAADLGVQLADVLDRAEPGDTVLALLAADGADAIVLRVTEAIAGARQREPVRAQLAQRREVSYGDFLTWRGTLEREPPRRPDPEPPEAPPAARAESWKFAFTGSRCERCQTVHLPPQRVCVSCGAVDEMRAERLADRHATVATHTVDRLAYSLAPPVIDVVLDFDGGGRYQCQLTDAGPDDVAIGGRVEMTFRRIHTARGVHNYFWKARPVDGQ